MVSEISAGFRMLGFDVSGVYLFLCDFGEVGHLLMEKRNLVVSAGTDLIIAISSFTSI